MARTPADISERMLWAAVLRGGYVTSPELFNGGAAAVVKYKAALSVKRLVFLTDGFVTKHRGIAKAA